MANRKTDSIQICFREFNVLILASLYMTEAASFYKFTCELTQCRDVHNHNRRGKVLYGTAQNRLQVTDHLPSQDGVRLLNSLPESIKVN